MCSVFCLRLLTFVVIANSAVVKYEVLSICGEDAVLRCPASSKPGVQYRSVIWYKISEAPSRQLNGLVRKTLTQPNSTIQKYNGSVRNMELRDSQSLVLHNLTLQDTGRYRCFLLAPLGQQNQEGDVHLRVYNDAKESDEDDSLYVVLAISLLVVSLLMLSISYICLRNTLIKHKDKFSKDVRLKKTNQIQTIIVSLQSKAVESKLLPLDYV